MNNNNYIVIDWRPYDIPQVYGIFDSYSDAFEYAKEMFPDEEFLDDELPDGILVSQMNGK